jgi:hypothetical protein
MGWGALQLEPTYHPQFFFLPPWAFFSNQHKHQIERQPATLALMACAAGLTNDLKRSLRAATSMA